MEENFEKKKKKENIIDLFFDCDQIVKQNGSDRIKRVSRSEF